MSVSEPTPTSPSSPSVQQNVAGDRNQAIGHMSGGAAINNLETLNQIIQQLNYP